MSELTKEFFEQKLNSLVTREHFDTKLGEVEQRVNTKLDAMMELLDVRHRVDRLEELVAELSLRLK